MPSLNRVMIIGNIGNEPEMRFTPSGKPTTQFRVAVNTKYTGTNGESKEETEWFSVVTWGKTAELCNQYLHKGSPVYVEGRNKTRNWADQEGKKHYRTELVAGRVLFLGSSNRQAPAEPSDDGGDIDPDDIPF